MSTPLGQRNAFPLATGFDVQSTGMSLRQYYAGLAMQGLLAQSSAIVIEAMRTEAERLGEDRMSTTIAREALETADALLAALEGKK